MKYPVARSKFRDFDRKREIEYRIPFPAEPLKPTKPIFTPIKNNTGSWVAVFGGGAGMVLLGSIATGYINTEDGPTVLIVCIIIIALSILSIINKTKKENSAKSIFNEKLKEYEVNLQSYKVAYNDYISESHEVKLQREKLKDQIPISKSWYEAAEGYFYRAEAPYKIVSKNTNGATESYFHEYLNKYFPNKIYNDISLDPERPIKYDPKTDSFPKFPLKYYHPDFVYYDSNTGLCIDIEIDEPYIGSDGTPINYLGVHDQRDKYFVDNSWLVIRFSEKQVFLYPDSCCYEIGKLIQKYLPDTIDINIFNSVENLPEDNCWDLETAKSLYSIFYRKEYLSDYFYEKAEREISTMTKQLKFDLVSKMNRNYYKGIPSSDYDDLPF